MSHKLLLCLTLCAGLPLLADDVSAGKPQDAPLIRRQKLDPADYEDKANAEKLIRERKELIEKMQNTRMELIRKDPKLKRLHEQIAALYRELAIELESKREMLILNSDLKRIDSAIDSLKKK